MKNLISHIIKPRFTAWIPIVIYESSGARYLLLARVKLKTGMPYFKVKSLQNSSTINRQIPTTIFDPKEQFEKLFSNNPLN